MRRRRPDLAKQRETSGKRLEERHLEMSKKNGGWRDLLGERPSL